MDILLHGDITYIPVNISEYTGHHKSLTQASHYGDWKWKAKSKDVLHTQINRMFFPLIAAILPLVLDLAITFGSAGQIYRSIWLLNQKYSG